MKAGNKVFCNANVNASVWNVENKMVTSKMARLFYWARILKRSKKSEQRTTKNHKNNANPVNSKRSVCVFFVWLFGRTVRMYMLRLIFERGHLNQVRQKWSCFSDWKVRRIGFVCLFLRLGRIAQSKFEAKTTRNRIDCFAIIWKWTVHCIEWCFFSEKLKSESSKMNISIWQRMKWGGKRFVELSVGFAVTAIENVLANQIKSGLTCRIDWQTLKSSEKIEMSINRWFSPLSP